MISQSPPWLGVHSPALLAGEPGGYLQVPVSALWCWAAHLHRRQFRGSQEAVIALALLLHRFRFTCTAECKPWLMQKLTVQPAGGLPMTVSAR